MHRQRGHSSPCWTSCCGILVHHYYSSQNIANHQKRVNSVTGLQFSVLQVLVDAHVAALIIKAEVNGGDTVMSIYLHYSIYQAMVDIYLIVRCWWKLFKPCLFISRWYEYRRIRLQSGLISSPWNITTNTMTGAKTNYDGIYGKRMSITCAVIT